MSYANGEANGLTEDLIVHRHTVCLGMVWPKVLDRPELSQLMFVMLWVVLDVRGFVM